MAHSAHLAVDLGAESGRVVLGVLREGRLSSDLVHRFAHAPVHLPSGLHWDMTGIWQQVLEGLRSGIRKAGEAGLRVDSIGVDTWGVDFALIGEGGELLGLPHAYRDSRFAATFARVTARVGRPAIYHATGIQFMPLNTLYQLAALMEHSPSLLSRAQRLLFMPDLLHYFLCGQMANEATIASTSQMIDPRTGRWAGSLLADLGLPTAPLHATIPPATTLGPLLPHVAEAIGASGQTPRVVAPAAHDTASAVAAVPADAGASWAFLSSGTWSLLGAELAAPNLSDDARDAGFTNEAGFGGTIRFLKNITGLWLVQECRRAFALAGKASDYDALTAAAAAAPPLRTIVDPDWPPLSTPGDLPARIAAYARATAQPAPETPGEFVRCCLDSLALGYRATLGDLERVLGRRFDVLHVVGGGARNALLNQLTAAATGRPLRIGPVEATATGNLLAQAIGTGALPGWPSVRDVVREQKDLRTVEPPRADGTDWAAAAERFAQLRASPPGAFDC